MEVDEEEERQKVPQVPISKWLLAEQEAQVQAAAAEKAAADAAAAAAAAEAQRQAELQAAAAALAEAMGSRAQAEGEGGQVGSRHHWHQAEDPALNEERRQKLRQVRGNMFHRAMRCKKG
jgi:U2-associated protein SR140